MYEQLSLLIDSCIKLLKPGATLVTTSHTPEMTPKGLETLMRHSLEWPSVGSIELVSGELVESHGSSVLPLGSYIIAKNGNRNA